jgi:hypothetical protein
MRLNPSSGLMQFQAVVGDLSERFEFLSFDVVETGVNLRRAVRGAVTIFWVVPDGELEPKIASDRHNIAQADVVSVDPWRYRKTRSSQEYRAAEHELGRPSTTSAGKNFTDQSQKHPEQDNRTQQCPEADNQPSGRRKSPISPGAIVQCHQEPQGGDKCEWDKSRFPISTSLDPHAERREQHQKRGRLADAIAQPCP